MSEYTDQDIFKKVSTLLQNIDQNQQVQQAAYENGIDVKNSTRLTAATKDNLAVSVIALLLAKRNNDPRCKDLVDFGLKHRTTKVDIINDYKAEANALITRYRNGERPEPEVQITINAESYLFDEDHIYDESYLIQKYNEFIQESSGRAGRVIAGTIGVILALPIAIVVTAIGIIVRLIQSFIGLFRRISPKRLLKKLEKIDPKDRKSFTFKISEGDLLSISVGHAQFVELYEEFSAFTDEFVECAESDTITKNLKDKAQHLINSCDKFSEKRGGDTSVKQQMNNATSVGDGNAYMTYEQCIEWLKELDSFNVSDLLQTNKKLQRCLSKLQAKNQFGADEHASDKKVGINDEGIHVLRTATLECVNNIQGYILGQNRLLKQADIKFNGVAESEEKAADRKKRSLERDRKYDEDSSSSASMDDIRQSAKEYIKNTEAITEYYYGLRKAGKSREEAVAALMKKYPQLDQFSRAGIIDGVEGALARNSKK